MTLCSWGVTSRRPVYGSLISTEVLATKDCIPVFGQTRQTVVIELLSHLVWELGSNALGGVREDETEWSVVG